MLEFLSNIANAIFTVFQLLLNMVHGRVSFFLMIPLFIAYLDPVFASFSAPLFVFLVLGSLISVILLIVGRN